MSNSMIKTSDVIVEAVERRLDQVDALRRIATQATDPKEVRTREGRGGRMFKYTDGAYVIRTLNQAFGHDWDFEADNEEVIDFLGQPFEVRCRGRLTVRLNGQAVTKVQYGSQSIEFIKDKQGNVIAPVTIGDCFKGAATDALKKCASMLGIALDLYDSDYRADKYADSEPEPVEPVRNVKLEGAQPTNNKQQQSANGTVRAIMSLAAFLGWDGRTLADEVQRRFKMAISDENPASVLEALPSNYLKELLQALQAEKKLREVNND